MKKLTFVSAFALAAMFTGCASYHQTGDVVNSDIVIKSHVNMVLDLENAKPVSATVKRNTAFGISSTNYRTTLDDGTSAVFGSGMSKLKKRALAKAKIEGNVDVILEPEYTTESHSYFFGLFKKKICTVKGYGVNVKGFKEASALPGMPCMK